MIRDHSRNKRQILFLNIVVARRQSDLRNYGTTEIELRVAAPDYKTTSQRDNQWGGSRLVVLQTRSLRSRLKAHCSQLKATSSAQRQRSPRRQPLVVLWTCSLVVCEAIAKLKKNFLHFACICQEIFRILHNSRVYNSYCYLFDLQQKNDRYTPLLFRIQVRQT